MRYNVINKTTGAIERTSRSKGKMKKGELIYDPEKEEYDKTRQTIRPITRKRPKPLIQQLKDKVDEQDARLDEQMRRIKALERKRE